MINVLLWKWESETYRFKYTSQHVNICAKMIKRHSTVPVKIFCITDDANGIDKDIIVKPIWGSLFEFSNNSVKPNCYRRLKMFDKDFYQFLEVEQGERCISIDIDCVILSNIDKILTDTRADFIGWRKQESQVTYQGSLSSFKLGSMSFLLDDFKGQKSRELASTYIGSDQAWVSYCLQNKYPTFTAKEHGVYSFKNNNINKIGLAPNNASIIFFHGSPKPWDVLNLDFVANEYRACS
jgi:hypothetical protein